MAGTADDRGYVLADYSGHYTPREWAQRAIAAYNKFDADRIVAEVNNGCDEDAGEVLGRLVAALLYGAPMSYREAWVGALCATLGLSLTPHQGAMH